MCSDIGVGGRGGGRLILLGKIVSNEELLTQGYTTLLSDVAL